MNVSDYSDEQVLKAYKKYVAGDSDNWRIGMSLLHEVSRRYGARLEDEFYSDGVKHLATIKPSLKHREEKFFSPDFTLSLDKVKSAVDAATSHGIFGMIEGETVASLASRTMRYQVPQIEDKVAFTGYVDKLLGERKGILPNKEGTRLFTFGSCFAVNIGRVLKERGYNVYSLLVAEDVNSTFNNLLMLKRVFLEEESQVSEQLLGIGGMDYQAVRREMAEATDIVFTLGNIFHLEDDKGPTIDPSAWATLVTETIPETSQILEQILGLLTIYTKARIIVSVSPVPISGYRGTEFTSAMEADCVSKSQLRAALHGCLRKFPGMVYIPTFEVFRWLPAHQSFATFGVDDGNCRHVSRTHVEEVLEMVA